MKHIHCPHFNLCSGCSLNEFVDNPPVLKEAKQFFQEREQELIVHSGEATGWRYRAKLAVRGTSLHPLIGLYKEGSHDVVAIPFCKVHHPHINKAVEAIRKWIFEESIAPYNEQTFQGFLRYLQLVVERSTGRVQLTLVMNEQIKIVQAWAAMEKLWEMGKDNLWHSLWINSNKTRLNNIFGNEWFCYQGASFLWEDFDGTAVCFHPASFAQANLDLFERMIRQIKKSISSNPQQDRQLVEYYAGVGVIGLCLVDRFQKITCCEISPFAELCFKQAKEKLGADRSKKIQFIEGLTEKRLDLLADASLVIVDPPRKGLDANTLQALGDSGSQLKELVYISCGWESFKRDADLLLSGGWKFAETHAFLFFPGSNHLETLAIFKKP